MPLRIDDVRAAAVRLAGKALVTPLLERHALNSIANARVFLKAESLQKGGAFKYRGAMNKLLSLSEQQRRAGVITVSSGNHALALAIAADELAIRAVVVMPRDAPSVKIEGARRNGAEVILYDRVHEDRDDICHKLIESRGLVMVPPYDDYDVMAGAGTGALEAVRQLPDGAAIDTVLVCCSGGGLASGWATVTQELLPNASLFVVEPEHFDDTGRSLREGVRLNNVGNIGTICDALVVQTPGKLTFDVMVKAGARGLTVSDHQVRTAMKFGFDELKLVLEPSGAAALAAVLARKTPANAKGLLLILSGGNVDRQMFIESIDG